VRQREIEALSADRFGVHFTADAGLRTRFAIPEGVELHERARALASHRGFVKRSRRSRCVPAAVRRAVYLRDDAQCSFVSQDGRRCDARALLELDHAEPWARLGDAGVDNIRLRCREHNNCMRGSALAFVILKQRLKPGGLQRYRRPVRCDQSCRDSPVSGLRKRHLSTGARPTCLRRSLMPVTPQLMRSGTGRARGGLLY
jgi:hypothetical protein